MHDRVDAFCVAGLGNATVLQAHYRRQRFAAHSHSTYVVCLVTSGALRFRCERQTWTAPAGSVCLLNPGDIQTGEAAGDEGWSYWSAYLPVQSFCAMAENLGLPGQTPFFPTPVLQDEAARIVLQRFFSSITATNHALAQTELSHECLAFLLQRFHETRELPRVKAEPHLVGTVKDYLAAHFSESVSLDDVASVANVTGFHLTRLFKATTGLALHAWLVQFRVEKAREMLMRGMPPAETAMACGFSDQPHMARWLRRLSGMTPREVQSMSGRFNGKASTFA